MAADRRDINRLNVSKGSRLRRASARESLSGAGNAADIRVTHTDEAGMVLQASTGGGKYYSVPLFDLNNPEPKTPGITRAGETIKITADNVLIPNDLTISGTVKGAKQDTETGLSSFTTALDIRGNIMVGDRDNNINFIVFNKSIADHLDSGSNLAYILYRSDEKSINFHTESNETLTIDSGGSTIYTNFDIGTASANKNLNVHGTSNLDNTDIDGTFRVDGTTFDVNATTSLALDNTNTSNGVTINTAVSGGPVSIGHTTSETTVNDNLTVTGTFTNGSAVLLDFISSQSLVANGYAKFKSGFEVKWGKTDSTGDPITVTFATAFTNGCFAVVANSMKEANPGGSNYNVAVQTYDYAAGSFKAHVRGGAGTDYGDADDGFVWIAIGY